MADCIFCKIIAGEIPGKIIDRNDQVLTFLSLQNHPLVVPVKHIENIYELDEETGAAVMAETVKISKLVKSTLGADGVNIVQNNEPAAGQEVMHLHVHIKPRFHKDGLSMHLLDQPLSRESVFEKLTAALHEAD